MDLILKLALLRKSACYMLLFTGLSSDNISFVATAPYDGTAEVKWSNVN